MIIEVDESFKKDFDKLNNKEIQNRIIEKLNILEKSNSLLEVSNVKKMSSFANFYRIRIWDYRIGLKLVNDKIILIRVRNRKDIYEIFP